MAIQTHILTLVRQHFPQLNQTALQEEIAEVGQLLEFPAGKVLMDYGTYVQMMPLLVKGSIKVSRQDDDGQELLLYFLQAGDTCSMSFTCCMMDKQSIIRTETIEDSTLIGIPTRYMDDWMSRYTSWKNFVMQAYNTRMLELVRTIDKIAFHNMDDRLRDYLRQRTQLAHSPVLNITHQDIASDLHASREAVSRLLKKMEQKGFLRLSRNQVEWLEPLD